MPMAQCTLANPLPQFKPTNFKIVFPLSQSQPQPIPLRPSAAPYAGVSSHAPCSHANKVGVTPESLAAPHARAAQSTCLNASKNPIALRRLAPRTWKLKGFVLAKVEEIPVWPATMEALYKKLYEKYSEEKGRKESQFDKLNHDQEVKFMNFTAAADEMMQYLRSENEKLSEQINDLKSELFSIRASSEQHVHYQNLLMEEKQKNEELSEEISRLQNDCSRCTMCKKIGSGQESSHDTPGKEIQGQSDTEMRKKRKIDHIIEGTSAPYVDVEHDRPGDEHTFGVKSDSAPPIIQQPLYCQRKIYNPGGDAADTNSFSCMFQYLVEFVVGMKVTPLTQSNELCILVHHQSSGYTFSLTWITNLNGEVELLYRVSSLGTFERVAPEWMKETLMFSTSMFGVFFDRVSRVIKSGQ